MDGPLLQLNLYLFKSPDKSHVSDTCRPKKNKKKNSQCDISTLVIINTKVSCFCRYMSICDEWEAPEKQPFKDFVSSYS